MRLRLQLAVLLLAIAPVITGAQELRFASSDTGYRVVLTPRRVPAWIGDGIEIVGLTPGGKVSTAGDLHWAASMSPDRRYMVHVVEWRGIPRKIRYVLYVPYFTGRCWRCTPRYKGMAGERLDTGGTQQLALCCTDGQGDTVRTWR